MREFGAKGVWEVVHLGLLEPVTAVAGLEVDFTTEVELAVGVEPEEVTIGEVGAVGGGFDADGGDEVATRSGGDFNNDDVAGENVVIDTLEGGEFAVGFVVVHVGVDLGGGTSVVGGAVIGGGAVAAREVTSKDGGEVEAAAPVAVVIVAERVTVTFASERVASLAVLTDVSFGEVLHVAVEVELGVGDFVFGAVVGVIVGVAGVGGGFNHVGWARLKDFFGDVDTVGAGDWGGATATAAGATELGKLAGKFVGEVDIGFATVKIVAAAVVADGIGAGGVATRNVNKDTVTTFTDAVTATAADGARNGVAAHEPEDSLFNGAGGVSIEGFDIEISVGVGVLVHGVGAVAVTVAFLGAGEVANEEEELELEGGDGEVFLVGEGLEVFFFFFVGPLHEAEAAFAAVLTFAVPGVGTEGIVGDTFATFEDVGDEARFTTHDADNGGGRGGRVTDAHEVDEGGFGVVFAGVAKFDKATIADSGGTSAARGDGEDDVVLGVEFAFFARELASRGGVSKRNEDGGKNEKEDKEE